jgi:hypothetical protein
LNTSQFSGINNRSKGRISIGTPGRAKAAYHFSMDHRGTQRPFSHIIGRFKIGPVQKNKEVLAIFQISTQQFGSIWRIQGTLQQPIGVALNTSYLGRELFWG